LFPSSVRNRQVIGSSPIVGSSLSHQLRRIYTDLPIRDANHGATLERGQALKAGRQVSLGDDVPPAGLSAPAGPGYCSGGGRGARAEVTGGRDEGAQKRA
jgi:hypothetical protein